MTRKGVIVTTYFSLNDALIQAYTLPYVRFIRKYIPSQYPVILVTVDKLRGREDIQKWKDEIQQLDTIGITVISLKYHRFGFGLLLWIPIFLKLFWKAASSSIDTIHAWCTPGGIVGYFLSVMTGKRLVLDSFEPHAEVMSETGTWKRKGIKFKILFWLEKKMARRSVIQICCTQDMKEYSLQKYEKRLDNYFIKPAGVDLYVFSPAVKKNNALREKLNLNDKIVCAYAGKFGGLYLQQEIFDFFACAYERWGERFRALLLTSEPDSNISAYCRRSGLPEHVVIRTFVPHRDVPNYLGVADFALAPYQPVPSRKHAAPIKISEYWALGLPVVITKNIADDSKIILENKIGSVISSLDKTGYRQSLEDIDHLLLADSDHLLEKKIRSIAEASRGYSSSEYIYQKIYG